MFDKQFRNKSLHFVICVIATVFAACFFGLFFKYKFYFSSNDDILIHNLMSGSYTGRPESHLVYIMYPLSWFFSSLYSIIPSVDWYAIFAAGGHYFCILLCIYRIGSTQEKFTRKLFFSFISLVLIILLDAKNIYAYQYTVMAGFFSITAAVWLITSTREKKADAIVPVILLAFSLWLRKEVFMMLLPLVLLSLVTGILSKKSEKETFKQQLSSFLVTAIPIVAITAISFAINLAAYSSEEWRSFSKFNEARTEVYDYLGLPDYSSNVDLYENVGISSDDFLALKQYDIDLIGNMNTDLFTALSNRQKELLLSWQQYYSVPRKIILDTVSFMLNTDSALYIWAFNILFFITFAYLCLNKKTLYSFICAGIYLYVWSFSALMLYKGRYPERISFPLMFSAIILFMGLFVISHNSETHTLFSAFPAIIISLFMLAIISIYQLKDISSGQASMAEQSLAREEINNYLLSHSEKKYLLDTGIFAATSEKMFGTASLNVQNTYLLGTWVLGSPVNTERQLYVFNDDNIPFSDPNIRFAISSDLNTDWFSPVIGAKSISLEDSFLISSGKTYNVYSINTSE